MIINGRKIGPGEPPYIIGELSCNHRGDYERLVLLAGAALGAGADAIKVQCYTPDTITLDCDNPDFIIKDGPWKGRKLYELYQKTHTPFEWIEPLFDVAKHYGGTVIASVFDKTSVDLLEKVGCPAYKIASMEIVDLPLIQYVADKGKPMILSTGMATFNEIDNALLVACGGRVPDSDIAMLHCVSGYPAKPEEYDLSKMDWMQNAVHFGISDHTTDNIIPIAATAMGAHIIEKHVKLWDDNESEDAAFSMDPDQFRDMCKAVRTTWKAMQPSEAKSQEPQRQLRRSLYVTQDMEAGEAFTEANVRSIRPGYGLPPARLSAVLGKRSACAIKRGTALQENLIA